MTKEKEKYYCLVDGELIGICENKDDARIFIENYGDNALVVKGVKIQ